MTIFSYRAVSAEGKTVAGSIEAVDERSAIEQLRRTGHLPISAVPQGAGEGVPVWLKLSPRTKRIPSREITAFARELATLLAAGLTIDNSLRTIGRHTNNPRLKPIIDEVLEGVRSGEALSKALSRHGEHFNALFVSLLQAGEASGATAEALQRIAEYRERSDAFRAAVVASLTYPALLGCVAVLSLFIMVSFVVPRFVPLFEGNEAILPLLTTVVFACAKFFQSTWWLFVGGIAALLVWLRRWLSVTANRKSFDAYLLRLPKVGALIRYADGARITRTLGSLLANGISLPRALRLAAEVGQNTAIRAALEQCGSAIEQGSRFADALARTEALPSLAHELIAVGEESGQLDTMLLKAAETLEDKTQARLKKALTLVEPVMILGLGALIAVIIVAILLAMLGLNDLVF